MKGQRSNKRGLGIRETVTDESKDPSAPETARRRLMNGGPSPILPSVRSKSVESRDRKGETGSKVGLLDKNKIEGVKREETFELHKTGTNTSSVPLKNVELSNG